MLEQIDITLEGVDSATDVRSETKTGEDSEVVMQLEAGSQETQNIQFFEQSTERARIEFDKEMKATMERVKEKLDEKDL